jgi:hypothetical protein
MRNRQSGPQGFPVFPDAGSIRALGDQFLVDPSPALKNQKAPPAPAAPPPLKSPPKARVPGIRPHPMRITDRSAGNRSPSIEMASPHRLKPRVRPSGSTPIGGAGARGRPIAVPSLRTEGAGSERRRGSAGRGSARRKARGMRGSAARKEPHTGAAIKVHRKERAARRARRI